MGELHKDIDNAPISFKVLVSFEHKACDGSLEDKSSKTKAINEMWSLWNNFFCMKSEEIFEATVSQKPVNFRLSDCCKKS